MSSSKQARVIPRIAVIGSGGVGKRLASGFALHGMDVVVGTRDANKLKEFAAENLKVRIGTVADAVQQAGVVVLAVPGDAAVDVL